VVCDGNGVSDFERLRAALARRGSREPFLYAFDLIRPRPWAARREALMGILGDVVDRSRRDDVSRSLQFGPGRHRLQARRSALCSARCPDWVKVRNPETPAASREFER
jgi:hypothetical protein